MPATVLQAIQELTARLEGAGIRAAYDVRNLNPPCALISAPTVDYGYAAGSWAADWVVFLVVPNVGTDESLEALADLLDRARVALVGRIDDAIPQTLTVDGSGDPLPAYQLTWSEKYT